MREATCSNCKFWTKLAPEAREDGMCRAHPPIASAHYGSTEAGGWREYETLWPSTHQSDWCGEYGPQEPPHAP